MSWVSVRERAVVALCVGAFAAGCGGKVSSDHGVTRIDSGESVGSQAAAGAGGAEGEVFTCEPTPEMLSMGTRLYPGPCRTEQDEGVDGIIDSTWEYSYDELNRMVGSESESTASGETYQDSTIYDEEGQRVSRAVETQDAEPIWSDTYVYEDGRLAQTITGPVAEGESPLITNYIYDGNLLIRLEESRRADGAIESRVLFEYDEAGQRWRDTYENLVQDEWTTERIVRHVYDAEGREVETYKDLQGEDGSPPDGVYDWTNRNWYNQHGNILVSAEDQGADGTIDTCTVRYYDCWL